MASEKPHDGPPHRDRERPAEVAVPRKVPAPRTPSPGRAARSPASSPTTTTDCQMPGATSAIASSFGHSSPDAGVGARAPRAASGRGICTRASRPARSCVQAAVRLVVISRPWRRTSARSRSVISAASAATAGVVDPARPGDVDRELADDPARAARQQHDPVAEAHRLTHVVGDEDDGQIALEPDPFELVVQHVAGHGVERTERLVHRAGRRRPGRGPGPGRRAGASRPTARGDACRRTLRDARSEQLGDARPLLPGSARGRTPLSRSARSMLLAHGEPREQGGAPGTSARCAGLRRRRLPRSIRSRPARRLRQRALAATRGSEQADELADRRSRD